MRVRHFAPGTVIHIGLKVLNQRAIAPDIERLSAVADGQNGLLKVECILQQELIDARAGWIGLTALRNSILAKSLRINIKSTTRQENPLHSKKQPSYAVLPFMQGNDHWGYADGMQGGKVGGQ